MGVFVIIVDCAVIELMVFELVARPGEMGYCTDLAKNQVASWPAGYRHNSISIRMSILNYCIKYIIHRIDRCLEIII